MAPNLKTILVSVLFLAIYSQGFTNPWPMGEDNRHLTLVYAVADYNRIYQNDQQLMFDQNAVTNESMTLYYLHGINARDTLVFSTRYSNIGAFPPLAAPENQGFSDSYLGVKRTVRTGAISAAWELGVLSADDYVANFVTAPGYGETEVHLAWYWGKICNVNDTIAFSARYIKRQNSPPNSAQLNLELGHRLNFRDSLRLVVLYDEAFGSVNLLDAGSGWRFWNFHEKDESQLIGGLGFARQINPDWDWNVLVSHKFDGRNTDASDVSYNFGVGYKF